MALNNLGLGFVFTARNLASGTINRLNRQVGTLGGTARRSGLQMRAGFAVAAASILPLVGGLGILGGALSLARAAANFEQGIQRVANISGATVAELRELRNAAIDAGIATSFSPDEAVEGLAALAAQGFTASESMGFLSQALALAEAGQIGVEDASRATAAAVRVFGDEVGNTEEIADRLLRITNLTALQAGDLTIALGTVSRGAGLTSQSLDEMLISMGLVRNAGVDVSVAASSVSSALQFMGRNAEAFESRLGVAVTDAAGNFRPFIDVVLEADTALSERFTNAAERATAATELFGRFGVTAFQNVSSQIRQGIRNSEGDLVRGAAAVEFLRTTMTNAGGTAEEFRDRLLDTFAGQGRLLQGTLQTLGVVLGEPFARVFKPMIKLLVGSLNAILRFFNDLPDPIKTMVAGVIVAAGVFLTFAGVLGIIVGLGIVLAPFFVAFVKIMGVLLLALAPVIVVTAALGAAIAGMVFLVRENVGGLGDFFDETFGRVRLAFRALVQLFTSGTLSGSVREELGETENSGLRAFVINLFRIGSRVRVFFGGIVAGFQSFAAAIGPRVERMIEAFREIGIALGFVDEGAEGLADTPMDDFASAGVRVGEVLADVLGFVVGAITIVSQVIGGFVRGITATFEILSPVFDVLFLAFETLGEEIGGLFRDLGIFTDEGGSGFQTFGEVIGTAVGFIATVFAAIATVVVAVIVGFVAAARFLISAWEPVKTFFFILGIQIAEVFDTIVVTIMNAIDRVIQFIGNIIDLIPEAFRPEALIGISETAAARRSERGGDLDVRNRGRTRAIQSREANESAAAAATAAATQARESQGEDVVAELRRGREEARRERLLEAQRPIVVQIDSETVATAVAGADRRAGARGFVPVPADVD